jgi:hypothetical protein
VALSAATMGDTLDGHQRFPRASYALALEPVRRTRLIIPEVMSHLAAELMT